MSKVFLSFEDAKKEVKIAGIRTRADYWSFIKRQSPRLFPRHPSRVYSEKWISWEDWVGKKRSAIRKNAFWSFEEARRYVRGLKIKSQKDWRKKCSSLPTFIPHTPNTVYKEWMGIGDWIGTNSTRGCCRKYRVNEDFFKTWNSDMAYILGFWFADGCIMDKGGSKVFSITQHKNDKYLLEKILKKMNSIHPLEISAKGTCYSFCIGSKKIFNDIIILGGKTRKSKDVDFPDIPPQYLADFIRGYFDGDGCVYLRKNGNLGGANFVCGSKKFINRLNDILAFRLSLCKYDLKYNYGGRILTIKERMAWINNKYYKFSENYRLELTVGDTRRLQDFMYNNIDCLKLERKYQKFLTACPVKKVGGRVLGSKNVNYLSLKGEA